MLINRDYARLWRGQAASAVGDAMAGTTLVLWVSQVIAAGRPWAPVAVSGILVAAAAACLLGPVAGVLVDRWDRRATMMRTETFRAGLAALFAGASFIPNRALPPAAWLALIYLTAFTLNGAGQLFNPARVAMTAELVTGERERARAASLTASATHAAAVVGPPVAAPLMITAGVHWALAVNAASYVISGLSLRRLHSSPPPLRPPAGAARSVRADLQAGLHVLARNRFLSRLLAVTLICQCGTASVTALNFFFVTGPLHATPRMYGVAEMAVAAGFVAGSLAAGPAARRAGARALTWSGLLAAAALLVAYALQRAFLPGLAVLAAYAATVGLLNSAADALLMAAAPGPYMGRVLAVFGPVNQVTCAAAMTAWGWLASTALAGAVLGRDSLIFLIAATLIALAGLRALTALPRAQDHPGPGRPGPAGKLAGD